MTDNQNSVTAGAVQPPTDRPLTAGDVHLLREGDVLIAGHTNFHTIGELVRYAGLSMRTKYVCFIKIEGKPGHYAPDTFTFIARPTFDAVPAARPATSAASEGEGAEELRDSVAWLEKAFRKTAVGFSTSYRPTMNAVHTVLAALASPPISERERELEGALREARDAVDFFDRVKAATQDEQIAVGRDHWNRMEAALRTVAALTAQPAEEGK